MPFCSRRNYIATAKDIVLICDPSCWLFILDMHLHGPTYASDRVAYVFVFMSLCLQFLSVEMSTAMLSWFCWTMDSMTTWMTETASVCVTSTRQLSSMTMTSWSNIHCSSAFKVNTLPVGDTFSLVSLIIVHQSERLINFFLIQDENGCKRICVYAAE